jgi:hypothetical protein
MPLEGRLYELAAQLFIALRKINGNKLEHVKYLFLHDNKKEKKMPDMEHQSIQQLPHSEWNNIDNVRNFFVLLETFMQSISQHMKAQNKPGKKLGADELMSTLEQFLTPSTIIQQDVDLLDAIHSKCIGVDAVEYPLVSFLSISQLLFAEKEKACLQEIDRNFCIFYQEVLLVKYPEYAFVLISLKDQLQRQRQTSVKNFVTQYSTFIQNIPQCVDDTLGHTGRAKRDFNKLLDGTKNLFLREKEAEKEKDSQTPLEQLLDELKTFQSIINSYQNLPETPGTVLLNQNSVIKTFRS